MKAIYEPKGRAREYAPLAVNLYTGCAHGCRYCYVPAVLRTTPETFHDPARVHPRPGILEALRRDAERLTATTTTRCAGGTETRRTAENDETLSHGRQEKSLPSPCASVSPCLRGSRYPAGSRSPRPVLLCFTSDPYQPAERRHMLTRRALEILGAAGLPVRVLTKNPALAERDFDLFQRFDVELGVTMVFSREKDRAEWEPHAPRPGERINALRRAHELGIRTWVSLEPVISPSQTLEFVADLDAVVDVWRVGKLNHDKARETAIDWPRFLRTVLAVLRHHDAAYVIKDDLWAYAGDAIRAEFNQREGVPEE